MKTRPPQVVLWDVMDTLVRDPFREVMPAFFGMDFKELLRVKSPTAWLAFKAIDRLIGLRAPTLNEQRGLDYTEHHEIGYPEFQESPGAMGREA